VHELLIHALLDDAALVHHHDSVGVPDCGQAMRDNERGAIPHQLLKSLLDSQLSLGVDVGRGLVQDEDSWVRRQRSGKAAELSLT
jgi:hypothetical protein